MRRGTLNGTFVTSCCLDYLNSFSLPSLHSGFRNCFMLDPFCSNSLIIFLLFYQTIWIAEFTMPNSWHTSASIFPFSICHTTLTFPFKLTTFHLFVMVAISSCYKSPIDCTRRNIEDSFTPKVNYHYCCHVPGLEFMWLPASIKGLPPQGWGNGRILKLSYFLENYTGTSDWQYHYVRGRCSYVCFNKQGRKTQFYHRLYNVIAEVLHKPRLNVSEYCTQEVDSLFISVYWILFLLSVTKEGWVISLG